MKKLKVVSSLLMIVCFSGFGQEQCLKSAWDSFNDKEWEMAIEHAEDCVFNHGSQAREIQENLVDSEYSLPRNYTIPGALSAQEKEEIFSHGLLNDVCVSYWIIGSAYSRLRDTEQSNRAFRNAQSLSFGLVYDPNQNLFWSPSKEASTRLKYSSVE